MSCKRPNRYMRYVKVRADHLPDETIKPLVFRDDEAGGEGCLIDQIMDVREARALKAGGQGIRYICRAGERQVIHLYNAEY